MSERNLGLALFGHGAIAIEHLRALRRFNCSVEVVLGANQGRAERFARENDIPRWTTNLDAALDGPAIDAVVIASPNQVHVEQTVAAAMRGKHVLCEVPLATSLAGAQLVADTVSTTGVLAMVCQTTRFLPAIVRLRQLISYEPLPPWQLVSLTGLLRKGHVNQTSSIAPRRWTDDVLWHHGAHALDTAIYLLGGAVRTVHASVGDFDEGTGRIFDLSFTASMSSQRLATLVLSYSSGVPINELIVIGESRIFRVLNGELQVGSSGQLVADHSQPTSPRGRLSLTEAVCAQDEMFVTCVRNDREPAPGPRELLPMFAALQDVESFVHQALPSACGPHESLV